MVLIGMALAFVVWFYHWTVRTSGGFNKPGEEDYYNFLVRGWRQGHLYLSKEPSPEMQALIDPYDPDQNHNVRMADASYFKKHYYLYFGPAPAAILMLPYDLITGRELGSTTAIYVFCVTGFLAASGLWLSIRCRYFPSSSILLGPLGVLMLGLGTHILALERRPLVWELPISMGFAFSMLAFVAIDIGLHGKRPVLAMGAAGLCLGLAVAARPICVLGTLIFLPPLWQIRRRAPTTSQWRRCALAVSSGLGICLMALFVYNFARFGNLLEFGQDYQLSGVYESKMNHFSISYIPHNFYLYYIHPGSWSRKFPFVSASPVAGGAPGYLGNWSEAIFGLGTTFPFVWIAFALPLMWYSASRADWRVRVMIGSVILYYLAICLAILMYFITTERYLADFAPSLGLLAVCGWLGLEQWAQLIRWNKIINPIVATACIITITAGILVSFEYHNGMLRELSPQVWNNMARFFARMGL